MPLRLQDDFVPPGFGWHADPPDPRDLHVDDPRIRALLSPLRELATEGKRKKYPRKVDLREYFPPVDHQRGVHCSCSFACVSLVEYFQRRWLGELRRLSVRFVYDVTRSMLGVAGNVATDIRSTLKAASNLGIPPERSYGFGPGAKQVHSPPPLAFGLALDLRGIHYFRMLDRGGMNGNCLSTVRLWLAAGIPFVFGFSVPETVTAGEGIACRADQSYLGGQAVVAVGYDDRYRVLGCRRGAVLIRNSWGRDWGDDGYGWLCYDFFACGIVGDLWSLVHPRWTVAE